MGVAEEAVSESSEPAESPEPVLDVLGRDAWGAEPIDAANAGASDGFWRVTVHHTGETAADASGKPPSEAPVEIEAAAERMRAYQAAHQRGRGWADIGYHFVIDAAGRVWEGRPLQFRGAHAGNAAANEGNVGIALMGNFDRLEPPPTQLESLALLVEELALRFEFDIGPATVHTHDEVRRAHGLGGTACPGEHLAAWLARYAGD